MVRESWLVDDELREAGVYHPDPVVNALIPHFYLHGITPEEVLDYCDWRAAYLARYARISPTDLEEMDPERAERLLLKVSELVLQEYKARAGANPFTAPSEDDAG